MPPSNHLSLLGRVLGFSLVFGLALDVLVVTPAAGQVPEARGESSAPDLSSVPGAPARPSAALSRFGLTLFRELAATSAEPNVVFSPISAGIAFGLLQEGAEGETRAELLSAFGVDDTAAIGVAADRLVGRLLADTTVDLRIGTSLWVREGRRLSPAFRRTAEERYDAQTFTADFRAAADTAAQRINDWAAEKTAGRIPKVVKPAMLKPLALLLLNAVYFKGLWEAPFDTARTQMKPFATLGGDSVTVPRMARVGDYRYLATPEYAAVRMPYRGDRFASYIFLPAEGTSVDRLTDLMTVEWLEASIGRFESRSIALEIPRFTHRGRWGLLEPLEGMGVRRVLDPDSSQLGGLWAAEHRGEPPSFVMKAFQSTFFKFDEEGTEAAAVTGIGISVTSVPPPPTPFVVDRPFLIVLRDDATGAVLFIARIGDPADDGGP